MTSNSTPRRLGAALLGLLQGHVALLGLELQEQRDQAKKIVNAIKDAKLKVDTQINGDKLRVMGKKRDDLQAAMAVLRKGDFGLPLQFNNFRD